MSSEQGKSGRASVAVPEQRSSRGSSEGALAAKTPPAREAIGSWLMRLFESNLFDSRLALHYLHLYPHNDAIQDYVCNAFRSFPEPLCEFWLPQIIHILVVRGGKHVEDFVIDRAVNSDHMAILTLWYLQTYLNQGPHLSSTNPNAAELLQSMYVKIQSILFGTGAPTSPTISDPRPLSPTAESILTVRPNNSSNATVNALFDKSNADIPDSPPTSTQPIVNENPDRTISPESEASSAGFVRIEKGSNNSNSGTGSGSPVDRHSNNADSESLLPSGDSLCASITSSNDRNLVDEEDLNGATDFDPMKESVVIIGARAQKTGASVAGGSVFGSGSVAFPLSAPSIEELGMGTAFNRTVKFASKPPKNSSRDDESNGSPDSGGRQSDVDWTIVQKPDYAYITDPRMRYFHSQLQFIMTLSDISDRLRSVPKLGRQSALFAELSLLNHNLPAQVCIPLWCEGGVHGKQHHWIVRVPPNDGVTLNSADRVPYLLILEIVDKLEPPETKALENTASNISLEADVKTPTPIKPDTTTDATVKESRPSTTSINTTDLGANSEENAEYYKTVVSRRHHLTPTGSSLPETPQQGQSGPQTSVNHSRSDSSSSVALAEASLAVDEYTKKMRTAAVMLAQLHHQQQNSMQGSGNSSPSGSNSPSPNRKTETASGVQFEKIRSRLVNEMSMLEEQRLKALEDQRAAEISLGIVSGIDRLDVPSDGILGTVDEDLAPEGIEAKINSDFMKKDKEDPSAAVFKESWDMKCSRIRASSPYGKNSSWKLVSVIVKSGSDLRQEVLALQLIKEMQRIWKEEHVPVWVHYYRVMCTSDQGWYSKNLNQPGVAYTLYDYFLQEFGPPASNKFLKAQEAFMRSLAGYSIVCYLLQIKDRHNGNILIDKDGHSIHIDFGFMLSNSPGNMGFELAPFKLPQEFIDILGGTRSLKFKHYRDLCKSAFLAIRKRWDLIVGLVEIMERDSVFPCFTGTSVKPGQAPVNPVAQQSAGSSGLFSFLGGSSNDTPPKSPIGSQANLSGGAGSAGGASSSSQNSKPVSIGSNPALPVSMKLKERFALGMTDAQVKDFVDKLVDSSINSIMTRLYDAFQWYSNGVL